MVRRATLITFLLIWPLFALSSIPYPKLTNILVGCQAMSKISRGTYFPLVATGGAGLRGITWYTALAKEEYYYKVALPIKVKKFCSHALNQRNGDATEQGLHSKQATLA